MIKKLFKTNNIYVGIAMGVITPLLSFLALYYGNIALEEAFDRILLKSNTIVLTSIFLNLFIYLRYILKDDYDRTGRGVLLITFVLVVIYVLIFEI